MSERAEPSVDAETLHQLKDDIFDRWGQLPEEHQASMALVLLGRVLEGSYATWLVGAVETLAHKAPPMASGGGRELLARAHLSEEEINLLDQTDLQRIAQTMIEHYVNDAFWDELEFVARLTLAEKRD